MGAKIYLAIQMESSSVHRSVKFATDSFDAVTEWADNREGRAYTEVKLVSQEEVEDQWLYIDEISDLE